MSDDLALRAVAKNDFGVQGALDPAGTGQLPDSGPDYNRRIPRATSHLIQANYDYVSVSSDLLVHSLRGQQWIVSSEFGKILNLLAGSTTSEQSAVSVLADFLKAVWLERILLEHKAAITDLGLEILTRNRLAARVVPKLRQAIRERLTLAPVQLQQIENQINSWQRLRRFMTQSTSLWG